MEHKTSPIASDINTNSSRRQFLGQAAALAGAAVLSPSILAAANATTKRTAVDQVDLGKTGLKLSRLGFGGGSNNGEVQTSLGQKGFNDLVRYAYDQGITYFDCAQAYQTFDWLGDAIKGLPREKLFLQSKIMGQPADIQKAIDRHRTVYKTDYVDSMLVHCMVQGNWADQMKRLMDGLSEAQEKKWIRVRGVSCHSLPALRTAAASDWPQVHLVRVNPQGAWIDGEEQSWNDSGNDVAPVMAEIKKMHAKGRGVIGMKLVGNGEFQDAADREKAIRFAMTQPEIHAVVMGFKSKAEIDEAIERINRALAAA